VSCYISKLFGRHGRGLISYIKEAARLNDEGIKLPRREKNIVKKKIPNLKKINRSAVWE
jgi:hypothetical protein